jgi:hypothetical protein
MAGRPTDYTPELGREICEQLLEGASLLKIVEAKGMPTYRTVMNWVLRHEEFFQNYTRAREQQPDAFLDKGLAELTSANGKDATLAAARKVEVLIKLAEKQNPRKYGNTLKLSGELDLNHRTDEQLKSELAQLLGKAAGGNDPEGVGAPAETP